MDQGYLSGLRAQGTGCSVLGARFSVLGTGYRVLGIWSSAFLLLPFSLYLLSFVLIRKPLLGEAAFLVKLKPDRRIGRMACRKDIYFVAKMFS